MTTDGLKKIDAFTSTFKNDALDVLKNYLALTRVAMGDGSDSDKICTLCVDKIIPAYGVDPNCACGQARELLRGYRK